MRVFPFHWTGSFGIIAETLHHLHCEQVSTSDLLVVEELLMIFRCVVQDREREHDTDPDGAACGKPSEDLGCPI